MTQKTERGATNENKKLGEIFRFPFLFLTYSFFRSFDKLKLMADEVDSTTTTASSAATAAGAH